MSCKLLIVSLRCNGVVRVKFIKISYIFLQAKKIEHCEIGYWLIYAGLYHVHPSNTGIRYSLNKKQLFAYLLINIEN